MGYQVYQNGIFLDESRAQVSIGDRSFLVGEGLFETLRAYQGQVVFLEDHLKRMAETAVLLKLEIPFSLPKLRFLVYETLHFNRLLDAVVRIYLSPEGESPGDLDSPPKRVNLLISCRSFESFPADYYEKGVPCLLVKGIYSEMGLISQIKSTNYLSRVLARRQARSQGAFEGILLNPVGQVTEGSGSNLFIVKDGVFFTPPVAEGLLAGVTRHQIFKIAAREGWKVGEQILRVEDLLEADEIFLTSTLKEVMPVASVEGKRPRQSIPGPFTRRMMEAYRDWIQWHVERQLSEAAGIPDSV